MNEPKVACHDKLLLFWLPTCLGSCYSNSIGNESVPIQLAQCCFPGLAISNVEYKYIFQVKHTDAILSSSTRKLSCFEISKNADCSLKNKLIVLLIIIFGTLRFPTGIPSY